MIVDKIKIRVRYAETDQMGYAHHGNYLQYFEMGRIELLRSVGVSYKQIEKEGIILPVYSTKIFFLKPARYDDMITLKTFLKEIPTARIIFEYEIYNGDEQLITTGDTTLIFVSSQKNKPMRIPQKILKKITNHF